MAPCTLVSIGSSGLMPDVMGGFPKKRTCDTESYPYNSFTMGKDRLNTELPLICQIPQITSWSNNSKHSIMCLTRFRGHNGLLTGLGHHISLLGTATGPPATARELSAMHCCYLASFIFKCSHNRHPIAKLDMSTARGRLKSPHSLSSTSAHHHSHISQYHGHEWMTHILFVACQSATTFLRYSNFRLWPWNSKVKVMRVVKGKCHTVGPVSYQLTSFSFHINQTNNSWDTAILKLDLESSKVKVMSEVKGQGHILYPAWNRCTSFSFHINRTNHSWDMAKIVFDLE